MQLNTKNRLFIAALVIAAFVLGVVLGGVYIVKTSIRSDTGPSGKFVEALNTSPFMRDFKIGEFDVIYPDIPIHSNRDKPGQTGLTPPDLQSPMAININDDVVTFNYGDSSPVVLDWLGALKEYEKEPSDKPLEINAQNEKVRVRLYIFRISMHLNDDGSRNLAGMNGMLLIDFDSPPDSQSESAQ